MISLVIDTSISIPTIAIIKDDKVLYRYHEKIASDMSSKILPIIDDAIKNTNIELKNIDKIFVINGPGSFTGVRIGVTIGKTIAYSLNKEIIPLSSLEFMSSIDTNKKYIIPMIDARRGNVFGAIYDNDLNCIKKDILINKVELLKDIDDDYLLVSYDNIENCIIPNQNLLKIVNKHISDTSMNPHDLKPNYLKLTEAEENRLKND